jgi:hypothetical protein
MSLLIKFGDSKSGCKLFFVLLEQVLKLKVEQ